MRMKSPPSMRAHLGCIRRFAVARVIERAASLQVDCKGGATSHLRDRPVRNCCQSRLFPATARGGVPSGHTVVFANPRTCTAVEWGGAH